MYFPARSAPDRQQLGGGGENSLERGGMPPSGSPTFHDSPGVTLTFKALPAGPQPTSQGALCSVIEFC